MTASERTALDLVITQLSRVEDKIDKVDDRVRVVELATAGNVAADKRTQDASTALTTKWGVRIGAAGFAVTFGLALSNFISLHN